MREQAYTLKNFPAARAIYLRNPIREKAYTLKKFPAARAIYLRNPIREKDRKGIYLKKISRCAAEIPHYCLGGGGGGGLALAAPPTYPPPPAYPTY